VKENNLKGLIALFRFCYATRQNSPIEELTKDRNDPAKMIGSGLKLFSGTAHFWSDGNKHEILRSNVVPYSFEHSLKK